MNILNDVNEAATLVSVCDRLQGLYLQHNLRRVIAHLIYSDCDKIKFNIMEINLVHCGIYAIAYATHLAHGGRNPIDALWHRDIIQCSVSKKEK